MPQAVYADPATKAYEGFADSLIQQSKKQNGTFDSVEAGNVLNEMKHGRGGSLPAEYEAILSSIETGHPETDQGNFAALAKGTLDGIGIYEREHGSKPTADVLRWAAHQGFATTAEGRKLAKQGNPKGATLDDASASSAHHDQISMQPNRAVVAVTAALAEAIPVATYLPADIGSNESKLIIISHVAGSDFGAYKKGDIMDGANNGRAYINSSRTVRLAADGTGIVTVAMKSDDKELCEPAAPRPKLLRGRSLVYVDGLPCGGETNATGSSDNSPMSGEVVLNGVTHVMTGSIKMGGAQQNEIATAFTPTLPVDSKVHVEVFVDFEAQPDLIPLFNTESQKFSLFANSWYAKSRPTNESVLQFSNETGIDIAAEAMLSIRTQYANERHFQVLEMAKRMSRHITGTFNFDAGSQSVQKSRAQIWQDFDPALRVVDQKMAQATMSHGSTHMYVGALAAGHLVGLPDFVSSGIAPRASIYRLGTWKGKDVYFDPDANETANSSNILLIGRDVQVARNPFVLGDAVPAMQIPLSRNDDFSMGIGFYGRSFTRVNPHIPSSMGIASIQVSNLPAIA